MSAISGKCAAPRSTSLPTRTGSRLSAALLLLLWALTVPAQRGLPHMSHNLTVLTPPRPAPEFRLNDLDETPHALSDYRGKLVLVNFWATWCPPCRREMPSMERLYLKFKDKGFTVLAINQMEHPDHVFAFTGQLTPDPSFPILFDPDSMIAQAFGIMGLPTSYLIDRHGDIRYRATGGREFDHPEIESIIEGLLFE